MNVTRNSIRTTTDRVARRVVADVTVTHRPFTTVDPRTPITG